MAGSMSEVIASWPSVPRPVLAASIAVFRDGKVLLAQRGVAPARGLYSLPGGRIEAGERLIDGVLRELSEEVGLSARVIGFVDHVEFIEYDEAGQVRMHAVIAAFAGIWTEGEPCLSEEASDLRWVDPFSPGDLPMTRGLPAILARAASIVARSNSVEVERVA